MTTEERVAQLEKSICRLRAWLVAFGTVLVIVACVGATVRDRLTFDDIQAVKDVADDIQAVKDVADDIEAVKVVADNFRADEIVADVVRARKFVVVDRQGKTGVTLTAAEWGGQRVVTTPDAATVVVGNGNSGGILEISDEQDITIARIGRTPDFTTFLSLWNSRGRPTISLNAECVGGIPGPILALFNNKGRAAVQLFAQMHGGGSLKVFDSYGKGAAFVECDAQNNGVVGADEFIRRPANVR